MIDLDTIRDKKGHNFEKMNLSVEPLVRHSFQSVETAHTSGSQYLHAGIDLLIATYDDVLLLQNS